MQLFLFNLKLIPFCVLYTVKADEPKEMKNKNTFFLNYDLN